MFSKILRNILHLLSPCSCAVCGELRHASPLPVCTMCEVTAPLTNLWLSDDNPMQERFWGLLPVKHASAMLWYVEGSPWREMIHRMKYHSRWRSAYDMGRWYGTMLKQSGLYEDIDMIIPVPLHPLRQMARGYNQSAYIAEGIAKELGVEFSTTAVVRHRYNRSQTRQSPDKRWDNVEGVFKVLQPKKLQGRHLLLVDDVFTTGATVMSLGSTILQSVGDVRLSVAVLAIPRHSLNMKE